MQFGDYVKLTGGVPPPKCVIYSILCYVCFIVILCWFRWFLVQKHFFPFMYVEYPSYFLCFLRVFFRINPDRGSKAEHMGKKQQCIPPRLSKFVTQLKDFEWSIWGFWTVCTYTHLHLHPHPHTNTQRASGEVTEGDIVSSCSSAGWDNTCQWGMVSERCRFLDPPGGDSSFHSDRCQ